MDDEVRAKTKLDAVVALADARHLPLRLKDSREAEDQLAFADVVLLNKTDLVDEAELNRLEQTIRQINPSARIHRTERAGIALENILDRSAFDLQKALANDPHFLDHEHPDHACGPDCDHDHHPDHDHNHDHKHHHQPSDIHDTTIESIALKAGPLNPDRFFPWLQKITQTDGPSILRLKGIIAFENDDDRYVVQGIHMLIEGDHERKWKPDEARESRIVFIGRDLDTEKYRRSFEACQA